MVDIIRRVYRSPGVSTSASTKGAKVPASSETQTYNDDRAGSDYYVTKDRRKKRDRRSSNYQGQRKGRALYDMRSGPGRRKEDKIHTIETKA